MVARELEGGTFNDVGLNGLILISTILDFAGREPTPGNEMAYVVTLPNMAAAAYYHGKVQAPSVEAIVEDARQFAIGPFITALLKGQDLPDAERAAVRAELARLTGLSERYLDQADLRVTAQRFWELLRDHGLTIGRLDARYTERDFDNAGETPDNDPSYGIDAGYTATINGWPRETLGFEATRRLSTGANRAVTGNGRRPGRSVSQCRALYRSGDAAKLAAARVQCAGLLRFRHALLRHRIFAQPDGHSAGPGGAALLRCRAHDVCPRRRPGEAVTRHSRLHPQR